MNKTDMIRRIAAVFSAAAIVMSFNGCDEKKDDSSISEKQEVTQAESGSEAKSGSETNYTITTISDETQLDNINIKSIEYKADRISVLEQNGGSAEKEYSQLFDIKTKEIKDIDLSSIDYTYIQYAVIDNGILFITYTDFDNYENMCTFDIESEKIIADKKLKEDQTLFNILADGKGSFTAISTEYTQTGKIYSVIKYDPQTLEQTEEIILSDKVFKSDMEEAAAAISCDDGSYFVFSIEYDMNFSATPLLYKVDSNNNTVFRIEEFDDWTGYFSGLTLNEKGNLLLYTTEDNIEYTVYEINPETGDTLEKHSFSSEKSSGCISSLSIPGYDVAYMNSSGISGYSFENNKSETILSFGKDMDTELASAYNVSSSGNSLFMYNLAYVESGRTAVVMDAEGNVIMQKELPVSKGYVSDMCMDDNGMIYYAETYDPGDEIDTVSGYHTAHIFHVMDSEGNLKSKYSIDDVDAYGDAVIRNYCTDSEGNVYMCFQVFDQYGASSALFVTDSSGKVLHRFQSTEDVQYVSDVVVTDGDDYVIYSLGENMKCAKLDYDNDTYIIPESDISLSDDSVILNGTGKYDFCYYTSDIVYGYSFESGSADELFNFADAGVESVDILEMNLMSENEILCSTYDQETGVSGIIKITKQ